MGRFSGFEKGIGAKLYGDDLLEELAAADAEVRAASGFDVPRQR